MKEENNSLQAEGIDSTTLMSWQKQLLVTKFYVPMPSGSLISRPRLTTLLTGGLKNPLMLISAPAGYGKTTLLSSWIQSFSADQPRVAWISLDEEDNDPQLFWTSVVCALQMQDPQRFTSLLTQLQSPSPPPLKQLLMALINLLVESMENVVLILDDYHLITEQQVHTSLLYLVQHLPAQLRIVISTRTDPPLPFLQLRARGQILEIRTDQLRCVAEETKAFFKEVRGIEVSGEIIQEVTDRIEGWLVGLRLLGLSLPERCDPLTLLQEASGSQRYILDYLTEEVLRRQPQEVQRFLLCTCILERLTAPLCDAVTQQTDSYQMLRQLEQANVFVVSLDSKRQWYRYHALFAEALYYLLKRTDADLLSLVHTRASRWYAEHNQTSEAILHTLKAHDWQEAANLIEQKSLAMNALSWGVSQYQLFLLRDWLNQIPADVIRARPRLCLTRIWMLLNITPPTVLQTWLDEVEEVLTDALTQDLHKGSSPSIHIPQARHELENMLGEAITYRALTRSYDEDGEVALELCKRAEALLSADNFSARAHIALTRLFATYYSSVNDAAAAVQIGQQAGSLHQTIGNTDHAISTMGLTAMHMMGAGQLNETRRLAEQAILLGRESTAFVLPAVSWPMVWQAEILRQWNELDAARSCIEEAIKLLTQLEWTVSLHYVLCGYAMLLRVSLSRGELDVAHSALQEIERISMNMPPPLYITICSHFTTIDKVRLWLACGELDQATRWAEESDLKVRQHTPYTREREEVARIRILLAKAQPDLALERLKPVLARTTAGQRWGHVIEIRLLQALAHQMRHEETLALHVLSDAVQLAEPEGYIRSFVDEGTPMEALLYQLRKHDLKKGPTPYLDRLLVAFQQESILHAQVEEFTKAQPLPNPLSERELQVLQLLAGGASNQDIARELVIAVDTVKRHVKQILAKLGVPNRFHAVKQAQALGLLSEES